MDYKLQAFYDQKNNEKGIIRPPMTPNRYNNYNYDIEDYKL